MTKLSKSDIFKTAWARVRNTGCTISHALKCVYGDMRKNKEAANVTANFKAAFDALNETNDLGKYLVAKTKVDSVKNELRNVYYFLVNSYDINTPQIREAVNCTAQIVKSKTTPSEGQLYKVVNTAFCQGYKFN